MAFANPANDLERLPWLEPYRETMQAKRRIARRSHGGLVAVAGALAVLIAAGGGYFFGQHRFVPNAPTVEVALTPAVVTPVVVTPVVVASPLDPRPVRVAEAEPPHLVRSHVNRKAAPVRVARVAVHRLPAVAPPTRVAARAWPKMPSPGPAGQVIQLGAFTNPARANETLRLRLSRYPLLGQMPNVVVPVITQPRGEILYVLRLGTASRQQSAIVCKNLRASGDHCLVIG